MALAPTIIRASSMTLNICRMPSCTPPTRMPTAGRSAPNVSSHVVEAFRPILCSTVVTKTPLRSPSVPSAATRYLGTQNIDRPLVPGPGHHQVEDVVGQVMLGAGDEALDAFEVPAAIRLLDRPGTSGADVGAGVRLGQHHRGAPLVVDRLLGEPHLLGRADR